jgi:hypothetical protein
MARSRTLGTGRTVGEAFADAERRNAVPDVEPVTAVTVAPTAAEPVAARPGLWARLTGRVRAVVANVISTTRVAAAKAAAGVRVVPAAFRKWARTAADTAFAAAVVTTGVAVVGLASVAVVAAVGGAAAFVLAAAAFAVSLWARTVFPPVPPVVTLLSALAVLWVLIDGLAAVAPLAAGVVTWWVVAWATAQVSAVHDSVNRIDVV